MTADESLDGPFAERSRGVPVRAARELMVDAVSALYVAVWAHTVGERELAADAAEYGARADPHSEFAAQLVRYLDAGETGGVYDAPAAFRAYIRGGGNVPLYEATSAALREAHARWPGALLDIGVGDGLALLPAIGERTGRLDVVEPSAELLRETVEQLDARGIPRHAYHGGIEDFAAEHHDGWWELTQATFALQSLEPSRRRETLRWIREHSRALVLAEFDVDETHSLFEPVWFRRFLSRVERGLREYDDDRDLVAQGFVLPVLLGKFDDTAARTNWEQPVDGWVRELREAGFDRVGTRQLYDYWWRPAYLIEAH